MTSHVVVAATTPRTASAFYRANLAELRARGFVVHLVTSPGPEVEELRSLVEYVHTIPMMREIGIRADIAALFRWIRLLRDIRPEVVFAGTPKAGLVAMLSSRLCRVPRRVYFLQGLRLEGEVGSKRRILVFAERLASRCSHAIIAVSPSLAAEYRRLRLNCGREVLVPRQGSSHGVDTIYYSPRRRDGELLVALGLDPLTVTAAFVGRLTSDKGPETLAMALELLHHREVEVQLLVIGWQDEPDSRRFVWLLEGSSQRVRVIGPVDDVRPYLAACDFLVLPTAREGMPNVVLEAAAMGRAAVTTTATGAIDSVVHCRTGLLFDYGDSLELANAMELLALDSGLRNAMGASARERMVSEFQPCDVARSIIDMVLP